jgi:hypothetical protein
MASDDDRPKENDATRAIVFVNLLRHADVRQEDRTISFEFDTAEKAFYAVRCLAAAEGSPKQTKEENE